jgi:hypothetical protein
MLNKIKVIGKFLPSKEKEDEGYHSENEESGLTATNSYKTENKLGKTERRGEKSWFYFSVEVPCPSASFTILRCIAHGETVERIKKEVEKDEVIEIHGYLRNEENGRQMLITVITFSKLDIDFKKIDQVSSNQVRLIGKIIDDLQTPKNNPKILSFRLSVPREGIKLPFFFCRVNEKKLVTEFKEKLKKLDIIILEGFLQTQKKVKKMEDKDIIERYSSIICYGFTLLDSDSVNFFSTLDNLTRVVEKVSKIDFSKPKMPAVSEEIE